LSRRLCIGLLAFALGCGAVFALTGAAAAQRQPQVQMPPEDPHGADINEGRTPAQVFATDCGVCHKSVQGLAKDRSPNALTSFLRQHYTTGIQQAGALAAYLASIPSAPEPRGGRQLMPTRVSPPERQPAQSDPRRALRPEGPGRVIESDPRRALRPEGPGRVIDDEGLRVRRPPKPLDARKPADGEKPSPIPEPAAAAKVPEERDTSTSAISPPVAPPAPAAPKPPEIPL
jgi:hypothetical protein